MTKGLHGSEAMARALERCAREPIHTPGAIQGHGCLIVLDEPDLTVRQASANLIEHLGVGAAEALGRPLAALLSPTAVETVRRALAAIPAAGQNFAVHPLPAVPGRPRQHALLHRHDGRTVLEIQPAAGHDGAGSDGIGSLADAIAACTNVFDVAWMTARAVARIARYDRTMIYRFLPDWSGEVIAEVKRADAVPFIGLRYPASDIPVQARRLYEANVLRIIADVDAPPVPVLAAPDGDPRPLDLGRAVLRAVSPVHLQYLRNMGVSASLTGSLMVDGRLWGLVACHHDSPRTLPAPIRGTVATIVTMASRVVERIEREEAARAGQRVLSRLHAIAGLVGDGAARGDADNPAIGLLCADPGLMDLAQADGVALAGEGTLVAAGRAPDRAAVARLARAVAESGEAVVAVEDLSTLDPDAVAYRPVAAGMLGVVVGRSPLVVALAFRREVVAEVLWGGDPSKPVSSDGETLTPRRSFAEWRQTVAGRCRPWHAEAVEGWRRLPACLADAFGGADAAARHLNDGLRRSDDAQLLGAPLLAGILDAVAGPFLVVGNAAGRDAVVAQASRRFREMFGTVPEDIVGQPLRAVLERIGLGTGDFDRMRPGIRAEVSVVAAAAGERNLVMHHQPLFQNGVGRTLSVLAFEDVTGHRRVETALRSAREQAQAANRAKSEFLANMSHELRTPLNAIIGFAEMMEQHMFGALGNDRYDEYVQAIRSAGEHLLTLIGDILDISKIEAGRQTLDEGAVDLAALVDQCCALFRQQAERRRLSLLQENAARPLRIQGDQRALRQIVLNLLSNAVKFTPPGGSVIIRVMRPAGGVIGLEVLDSGIGIPEEHRVRVFDPFYQVEGAYTRSAGGTGLGLALVRVLAELHDARVSLDSRPGQGTAVRVVFPAWRTMAAADAEEGGAPPAGSGGA